MGYDFGMRHRQLLIGGLAGVGSALCAGYLIINWPLIELGLFGPVLLWRLITPPHIRSHPRRNAYLLSFSLLILASAILILDQPQDAASSASSTRLAVSISDSQHLKDIRFSEPPTVTLEPITTAPGTWRWLGILEFTLQVNQGKRKERDLLVFALLPNSSRVRPWGNVEPDKWQLEDLAEDQDLLYLIVHINRNTSERRVIVSFLPDIPSHRMRLGERRILLSRAPFLVGDPLPGPSLPRLQVKVPLSTTDLIAQPTPSYALRDTASWQLSGPITRSNIPTVNLNPATSMEGIDITLTDRRIRLLADLSVELLLLAGGLLLGLIIEPAMDLSGIRQRQALLERTAPELETQVKAASADPIRGTLRRFIRLIAFIEAARSAIQAVRHRRK